jgi:hypothetical protein
MAVLPKVSALCGTVGRLPLIGVRYIKVRETQADLAQMYDRDLTELQTLLGQWAQTGQIDVGDWGANEVMTILSGQPELRERFVALLQCRLGEPIH